MVSYPTFEHETAFLVDFANNISFETEWQAVA